ncbi:MAG: hypothetical protein ABI177_06445 [Edaphobacter sp.]
MRLAAGAIIVLGLAFSSGLSLSAQGGTKTPAAAKPAEVSFQFEREGLPVPRFTLRVEEDGTGSYQAEEEVSPADKGVVQYASPKHIDRSLKLTMPTVAKIFKAARALDYFDMSCESTAKNIANTGKKTLRYAGADGAGSCIYNYSSNKEVTELTDTFLSIAFTLDEGRRLEFLHRYDRLGLDEEMTELVQAAKAGHALELETIAPVLTSIAGDAAVIERVRSQATKLLEQSQSNKI